MPFQLPSIVLVFTMGKKFTDEQLLFPRIKDIRRRPRATTPSGGVAASQPSGAFSSPSAAPAFPSTTFSAPPTQSTGFAFGQSQSFPGANSGPSQPSQGGAAPFSFGGSGSTGFNFSSSGFGSPAASNPFATNSFTGNSNPTQTTSNASTGFGFGNQPTTQQPFSAGGFGMQQPASTSTGTGMFGQGVTSAAAKPAAESMQMSPDAKPKAPSFTSNTSASFQTRNLFGDSGAPNPFSPKHAATPSSNPFGGLNVPSTTDKPSSDKAEGFAAKPAFAAQPTAAQTTQAAPFGSLFGATPAASMPSEPGKVNAPPSEMGNLFSPKPAAQPAPSNPFAPKPVAEQATSSNPFALKTASGLAATTAANSQPSQPLFGAAGASQPTFGNRSTSKPAAEQAPLNNLFAPKPVAEQETGKPTGASPVKPLFGATPATTESSGPEKVQPSPATSQNPFVPKPTETQPFGSLFGATPASSNPSETEKPQSSPTAQNLFAPKPATQQATSNNLFIPKPAATLEPSESEKTKAAPPASQNLFAPKPAAEQASTSPVQPPSSQPFGNLFGSKAAAPVSNQTQAALGISPASSSPPTAVAAQKAAARIPKPGIPAGATKKITEDSELLCQLRSLDKFFKEEILKCEAGTDAFDNSILFYLRVRQALGAPLSAKGATQLKLHKQANQATSRQDNGLTKKPAVPAGPNSSATSSLFSQSFSSPSSSPANPVNGMSEAKSSSPSSFTPAPQASQNPFASLSTSTATTTSAEKAPAANPFAGLSTSNATAKPAEKAASAAAPSASSLAGNMFANGQTTSMQGATTPPQIPKFGNGASGVDFMAQFQKRAEQTMAEEKAKRKAEDFDSDSDDEEEWERRDAEKQREKRAKLESAPKKKSVFVPGEGFKWIDADEPTPSNSGASSPRHAEKSLTAASPALSSASIFDTSSQPLSNSENIFARLSATPQPSDNAKDSDESDNDGKTRSPKRRASEYTSGDEGDITTAVGKSKRSKSSETPGSTKSSLDTPLPAPTAAAGRSLFDRVQSPAPQNDSSTSSLFSASLDKVYSSAGDHTWKPNSPIKFSSDSTLGSAPALPPSSVSASENVTPAGGASGAATPDEEVAPGAIFDLSNANAGEEEEEVAFECRARAFKLATGWTSQGTGIVRLLQHPGSGRARIILRADPGGQVILNTLLKKDLDYARASNSVQFMVPLADQQLEHWAIRVKAGSIQRFHDKIQEIKN